MVLLGLTVLTMLVTGVVAYLFRGRIRKVEGQLLATAVLLLATHNILNFVGGQYVEEYVVGYMIVILLSLNILGPYERRRERMIEVASSVMFGVFLLLILKSALLLPRI